MSTTAPRTLLVITKAIKAHLVRFEHDNKINPRTKRTSPRVKALPKKYSNVLVQPEHGVRVWIRYQDHTGGDTLMHAQAERYLDWLDAGNVGTHHEMTG